MTQRFQHRVESVPFDRLYGDLSVWTALREHEDEGWELVTTHYVVDPSRMDPQRTGEHFERLMLFFRRPVAVRRKRRRLTGQ